MSSASHSRSVRSSAHQGLNLPTVQLAESHTMQVEFTHCTRCPWLKERAVGEDIIRPLETVTG